MSRTRILGIVAEYDPFHLGHLYHLTEAKKRVQPDLTYVVLSPCFKQRGTPAMLSPSDRAFLALKAGADAVFALPVLWAVRDAEHYALGAVSLLAGLGATHLAFGAETDNPALLRQAACLLESPSGALESALRSGLDRGEGWPSALSAAAHSLLPEARNLLSSPNNVLAVCYLRAILRLRCSLEPVVIRRSGRYHADAVDPVSPSASALRDALRRGHYNAAYGAVPPFTATLLRKRLLERRVPDDTVSDALLLARLREMTQEEYANLPDVSEGLENALRNAAQSALSREEVLRSLTGVRYPAARISRLCAYALLGVSRGDVDNLSLPNSALLLGLRRNPDMTAHWKHLRIPVISSFIKWKTAANPADLAAWRLWAQCCRLPDTLPFTERTLSMEQTAAD